MSIKFRCVSPGRSSRSICANMAEKGRKRRYEAALINHPSRWLMNHKNHK